MHMIVPMTGDEIREIRVGLGLTQEQMARLLGYSSNQRISDIERGTRDAGPAVELLLRAYRDGHIPLDWLDRG